MSPVEVGTANQDDFQASEGRDLPVIPVGGGWDTLPILVRELSSPRLCGKKKKSQWAEERTDWKNWN